MKTNILNQNQSRRNFLKNTAKAAMSIPVLGSIPFNLYGQKYNTTLNIMSHPGQILPIFTHHEEYLKSKYGIQMKLLESPDPTSYQDSLKDLRSGGGKYDIVMHFPRYNGELAYSGYLKPLDDLISKNQAEKLFNNINPVYRKLYCEWGGQTIAIPVDGDVAMLYYRKDAIENKSYQQKFKQKYGKNLTVPRTWDDFKNIAEFFTGWNWCDSGKKGYGFQTSTWDKAFIEQQWGPMMASAGGNWFDDDCNPGFNNQAGWKAATDLKELLDYAPSGSASLSWGQTMESIFADDVALSLWYMDLGRLGWADNSWFASSGGKEKMKKFGYAMWPGYEEKGVYRNFNSMFYGRVVGISNFTKKADAAFEIFKTLLTPERRVLSMDDAQSGSDMFLETDYNISAFKTLTPAKDFLNTAKKVISNGFSEMLMPGTGEYMDALQSELHGYINGKGSAKTALNNAANRWQSITNRYGRNKQKQIWGKVKASYIAAGLNITK